ncbi:trigger factor, partial [Clostridioides difficile]|nr:trigger factor [Clostridioides difficile]
EEISKDNGLVMVLNVEVKPEFELGNYKGIEIAKVENTVSDENVDAKLQEMVEKNARLVSVEDKALEDGDTAIIDFEGFENGVAFDGGKGENYNLVIGSNTFIPGFEEQLVGKKAGEEVEVNVTFPEEYHSQDLAGKPVVFNVKINDVKVKELSALDDEFAKDTSEFDSLDELKADVRANLEEEAKNRADAETRNSVVEKVAENTEIEIPEVMIQHQIDNMLNELNYQLQYQGFGLQQLLEMTGRTMEELREERKEDAKKLVKSSLVLEAITKAEGIEATEEEFKAELEKMASAYNMEVEKIEASLRDADKEDIKGQIKIRKTIDLLVDNATIA